MENNQQKQEKQKKEFNQELLLDKKLPKAEDFNMLISKKNIKEYKKQDTIEDIAKKITNSHATQQLIMRNNILLNLYYIAAHRISTSVEELDYLLKEHNKLSENLRVIHKQYREDFKEIDTFFKNNINKDGVNGYLISISSMDDFNNFFFTPLCANILARLNNDKYLTFHVGRSSAEAEYYEFLHISKLEKSKQLDQLSELNQLNDQLIKEFCNVAKSDPNFPSNFSSYIDFSDKESLKKLIKQREEIIKQGPIWVEPIQEMQKVKKNIEPQKMENVEEKIEPQEVQKVKKNIEPQEVQNVEKKIQTQEVEEIKEDIEPQKIQQEMKEEIVEKKELEKKEELPKLIFYEKQLGESGEFVLKVGDYNIVIFQFDLLGIYSSRSPNMILDKEIDECNLKINGKKIDIKSFEKLTINKKSDEDYELVFTLKDNKGKLSFDVKNKQEIEFEMGLIHKKKVNLVEQKPTESALSKLFKSVIRK